MSLVDGVCNNLCFGLYHETYDLSTRMPAGNDFDRDRLRRSVGQHVAVGSQLARLDRRALRDEWESVLQSLLETLARR